MLTHVEIDGFKSFSEFSVDLDDFNLIVGANGSGFMPLITRILAERFGFDVTSEYWIKLAANERTVAQTGDALWRARDSYTVAFIHRDGGGNADLAYAHQIKPLLERRPSANHGIVPVIPVREMEAWLLADAATLARCSRVPQTIVTQYLEKHKYPEKILDPKKIVEQIYREFWGGRSSYFKILDILAQDIPLAAFAPLPSFQRFLTDLDAELARIGYTAP